MIDRESGDVVGSGILLPFSTEVQTKFLCDVIGNCILSREDVSNLFIVLLTPKLPTRRYINQFEPDSDVVADLQNPSDQDRSNA